ncbi:MAG: hypothetical protein ACLUZZ_06680 [Alistipes inops]
MELASTTLVIYICIIADRLRSDIASAGRHAVCPTLVLSIST